MMGSMGALMGGFITLAIILITVPCCVVAAVLSDMHKVRARYEAKELREKYGEKE